MHEWQVARHERPDAPPDANRLRDARGLFEQIVDKYDGTAVAVYARFRLARICQFEGRADRVPRYLREIVDCHPGTLDDTKARLAMGLHCATHQKDLVKAAAWYASIRPPDGADQSGVVQIGRHDGANRLYMSAQQELGRALAELGHRAKAVATLAALEKRYPHAKATLGRFQSNVIDSVVRNRTGVDIDAILDRRIREDILVASPAHPAATGPATEPTFRSAATAPVDPPRASESQSTDSASVAAGVVLIVFGTALIVMGWKQASRRRAI